MIPALSLVRRAIRLSGSSLAAFALASSACGHDDASVFSEAPLLPGDSVSPPGDPPPPPELDSTLPPPAPAPPPDSTVPPPPDSAAPPVGPVMPPAPPPVHVGIPFGPFHLPPALYGPEFTGVYLAALPESLLAHLEAA